MKFRRIRGPEITPQIAAKAPTLTGAQAGESLNRELLAKAMRVDMGTGEHRVKDWMDNKLEASGEHSLLTEPVRPVRPTKSLGHLGPHL